MQYGYFDDEKREYVISNDDDVFKVILNGIFPNND